MPLIPLNVKKAIRLLLLYPLCMASNFTMQAQENHPVVHQKIIPPSPEAQAFLRYGEYPVDHSTGIPKIEIPLYEVTGRKLSLPVSITYHASGIRLTDIASVAGLGWRLNAGGVFTRTVKGLPDEAGIAGGYYTKAEIDNTGPGNTLYEKFKLTSQGKLDSESDNYFYSAGNQLSGQFVYDDAGNMTKLTYSTDKIIKHTVSTYVYWFEVVKDDGTRYFFDQIERSMDDAVWYPTSWWLSKIISADNTDTIGIEYENYPYTYTDFVESQSMDYHPLCISGSWSGLNKSRTYITSEMKMVKRINFNNGYVQFDYLHDRLDLRSSRLSAVSIYSNSSTVPVKKYRLVQSHFWSGYAQNKYNYRLRLDTLAVTDYNNAEINNYSFRYNGTDLPPYPAPTGTNPGACNAIDYWGYYNGQTQNPNQIPWLPAPLQAANRNPQAEYAKACMLETIYYPTGGYSIFNFQANKIGNYSTNPNGGSVTGGLRIASIVSMAANEPAVTKRYEYYQGRSLTPLEEPGRYSYEQWVYRVNNSNCSYCGGLRQVYMSTPLIPLSNHNGSPVLYESVNEFTAGNGNSRLKTSYLYHVEQDATYEIIAPRFQNEYSVDRSWARGQLINTAFYKQENDTYKRIKYIGYDYSDFYTSRIITGTKMLIKAIWEGDPISCNIFTYNAADPAKNYFYYFDTYADVGIKKLTRETVGEYDDDGNFVVKTKSYQYESPSHLFPTKVTFTDSKGNSHSAQSRYPHNFAGTAVYDSMIAKNIISPEIEQLQYKNSTVFLQSSKTNYKYWGNGIIAPETVETKKQSNASETRLRYHILDNRANLLQVSKENNAPVSYIWDYGQSYPVAEAKNALSKDIAYTSFEAEGKGNFTFTGTPVLDSTALTGKKAYNLNGSNNIVKTGLTSATAYTVSYWTKNPAAFTITGTQAGYPIAGRTINGWKYFEHRISAQTQVTISGSGWIDEVRLHPEKAQMTSYTYEPLTGITSANDINNHVTYYEYDKTGRLVLIRDQDRNILKKICYNYAGKPENCNGTTVYTNRAAGKVFTRNNCATNYTGGKITFTVSPGTYSSTISQADADQQAYNYINANGQAYANANGACLPPYRSVEKNATFTRNNCGTGYTGSAVTYTVAAGAYGSTTSQADADQQAQNDVNTNGQAYANTNGTCSPMYQNVQKSGTFTRSNCGSGYSGSTVTYTVAAGTYGSTTSQADADQQAQNDVNTNGQSYANNYGLCALSSLYQSVQKSGTFTRNNCGAGYIGGTATYSVAAGAYTSVISQADADQQAQNDVNANGQTYANSYGTCTRVYSSVQKSGTFTRNNCGSTYQGGTVTYTVAAGTYTSTISQADADQKAQNDVNANGQAYANANGTCTPGVVDVKYQNFTAQSFTATYRNTATGATYTYALNANRTAVTALGQIPYGTYNITITTPVGTALYEFFVYGGYQSGVHSYSSTVTFNCNCGDLSIADY